MRPSRSASSPARAARAKSSKQKARPMAGLLDYGYVKKIWQNTRKEIKGLGLLGILLALVGFYSFFGQKAATARIEDSPNSAIVQNSPGTQVNISSPTQRTLAEFRNIQFLRGLIDQKEIGVVQALQDVETTNLKLEIEKWFINNGFKGEFNRKTFGHMWLAGHGVLVYSCGATSSVMITQMNTTKSDEDFLIRTIADTNTLCTSR